MIRPGTLALRGTRTAPLAYALLFKGIDLTGADLSAKIMQAYDGTAELTLSDGVSEGATGIRIGTPATVEGVVQTPVTIFITESDMAAFEDAAEEGMDLNWVWALWATPSGGTKARYLEGPFKVGGAGAGTGSGSGDAYDAIVEVDDVSITVIMGSGAVTEAVLGQIAAAGADAVTDIGEAASAAEAGIADAADDGVEAVEEAAGSILADIAAALAAPNGTVNRYLELVDLAGGSVSGDVVDGLRRVEQLLYSTGAIEDIIAWVPAAGDDVAAARQMFVAAMGTGRLTGTLSSFTEADGFTVAGLDTGIDPGLCGAGQIGIGGYMLSQPVSTTTIIGSTSPVNWGLIFVNPYQLLLSTFDGYSAGVTAAYLLKLRGSTATYPLEGWCWGYRDEVFGELIRNRYPLTGTYFRSNTNGTFPANGGTAKINGSVAAVGTVVITRKTTRARAMIIQQAVEEFETAIGRSVAWEGK
jgi:hypothetical protein